MRMMTTLARGLRTQSQAAPQIMGQESRLSLLPRHRTPMPRRRARPAGEHRGHREHRCPPRRMAMMTTHREHQLQGLEAEDAARAADGRAAEGGCRGR